ncbi:ATP-binding protein [Massilia sp. METH4]|uniref:sensor histidine kinase n=1 Tax=Massilia sp. METH4 TaxID=3123041 RepID=UPI0030D1BB7E
MKRRRHAGLGDYLAVGFCGLASLLSVLIAFVIGDHAVRQAKREVGLGLVDLARQIADKLDSGMQERYREVQLMSRRPDLVGAGSNIHTRRAVLDERQATYPHYAWIGMAGPDGRVIAATRRMFEGTDVSARPWFRSALKGLHVVDVSEAGPAPESRPDANAASRFVDIAFPYSTHDSEVAGVLAVHLSWNWAREVRDSVVLPSSGHRNIQALIVSETGKVLLGSGKHTSIPARTLSSALRNADGYLEDTWTDGGFLVGHASTRGYRDYPGLGWRVVVRQEADEAYRTARALQKRVMLAGVAAALLSSLLGYLMARYLARPLRDLAATAERIKSAQAHAIALPPRAYSEVRALVDALNRLISGLLQREQALDELNRTLEQRVARRTEELEQARAQAHADEARIQTIIENAPDAFISISAKGDIRDWNPAAQRLFGWRREEVGGRSYVELLIPPRFRQGHETVLQGLCGGTAGTPRQRFEWLLLDRRGEEVAVEVTVGRAATPNGDYFGVFVHDISERKRVERMKKEFISTVSHELRTPMTSINASLLMLSQGMAGELPRDAGMLIDVACRSTERMIRLVNDMLDMEKIESGNLQFEIRSQPLSPLLRQAIDTVAGTAAARDVRLVVDGDATGLEVLADHDRIIQVLVNLLSNAIKFSPAGGVVHVRVEQEENAVSVAVCDQGRGIPAEFQDRIFQRFAQADSSDSRRREGTGLGLAICKAIIEEHGGDIGFVSQPDHGTQFYIVLPQQTRCPGPAAPH